MLECKNIELFQDSKCVCMRVFNWLKWQTELEIINVFALTLNMQMKKSKSFQDVRPDRFCSYNPCCFGTNRFLGKLRSWLTYFMALAGRWYGTFFKRLHTKRKRVQMSLLFKKYCILPSPFNFNFCIILYVFRSYLFFYSNLSLYLYFILICFCIYICISNPNTILNEVCTILVPGKICVLVHSFKRLVLPL